MKQQKEKPPEQLQLTGGRVRGSPTLRSFCPGIAAKGGENHLHGLYERREGISQSSNSRANGFDVDLRDTCKSRFSNLLQFGPGCYQCISIRRGHFCRTLTVTREFRLCLHPESRGSVSSRYTFPRTGLARRFLTGQSIPQNVGQVKETA